MLRAGLVGVTGYTGMELSRILASHPSIRLTAATSRQDAGRRLDAVYPFLQGLPGADVTLIEPEVKTLAENCDVVFLAVPHGVAMEIGADLYDAGVKVVVFSQIWRISAAVSSRASTTREKPSSSQSRAPSRLWMLIWVEACTGRVGAHSRTIRATARSWVSTASTPASAAVRMVSTASSISSSNMTMLMVW